MQFPRPSFPVDGRLAFAQNQVKLRVRFSLNNLKLDDDVLNIPLFQADQADRLISQALRIRGQAGIESK